MTKAELEDAPGFIFSTALLPPICTAATAAIRHLKGISVRRGRHSHVPQS